MGVEMLKFKFAAWKNTVMIIPIHKIVHGSNIIWKGIEV